MMPDTPDWAAHNKVVSSNKLQSSQTLIECLKYVNDGFDKFAIDLGCGSGLDTLALLSKGWKVLAIDQDVNALKQLQESYTGPGLELANQSFENLSLPAADLINASFSLPFCDPDYFDACWLNISNAIKPGGFFCGHFFGLNDSWINRKDLTFHSKRAVETLFKDFEILWQKEIEKDGKTIGGSAKHWHVFHTVVRKVK